MSLDYAVAEEEVEYCASFSMISKNDDVIYMYQYNIVNIGLGLDAATDEEDLDDEVVLDDMIGM